MWEPDSLNFALAELRREFPLTAPERIVRSVDLAARGVRSDMGRVRLLREARHVLRNEPLPAGTKRGFLDRTNGT